MSPEISYRGKNDRPQSSFFPKDMAEPNGTGILRELILSRRAIRNPSLTLTEKSLLQAKAIYDALIMNPKERGEAGIRVIVLGDFTKTKKVQTKYPISRYSVYVLFHNIQDMREDPTDARPIFVSTSNSRLQDVMPEGESADLLVNYQADAIRYETPIDKLSRLTYEIKAIDAAIKALRTRDSVGSLSESELNDWKNKKILEFCQTSFEVKEEYPEIKDDLFVLIEENGKTRLVLKRLIDKKMGLRLESPSTASSVRVSSETITTGISSRLAASLRHGHNVFTASDTDQVRVQSDENPVALENSPSTMHPPHDTEVLHQLISSYNTKKDPSLTLTEKSLLQAKAIYDALIMNPKERGEAGIRIIVLGDFTKPKKVQTQYPEFSRYFVYVLFPYDTKIPNPNTNNSGSQAFIASTNVRLAELMPEGEKSDLLIKNEKGGIEIRDETPIDKLNRLTYEIKAIDAAYRSASKDKKKKSERHQLNDIKIQKILEYFHTIDKVQKEFPNLNISLNIGQEVDGKVTLKLYRLTDTSFLRRLADKNVQSNLKKTVEITTKISVTHLRETAMQYRDDIETAPDIAKIKIALYLLLYGSLPDHTESDPKIPPRGIIFPNL